MAELLLLITFSCNVMKRLAIVINDWCALSSTKFSTVIEAMAMYLKCFCDMEKTREKGRYQVPRN